MKNLNNTHYDPIEIYSNSKKLEPDTSPNKLDPDIKDLTKGDKPTNNLTNIDSICIIKDSDFDSLFSPCVASKQTRVVIRNKPMTKVDDKLDKVHIDLWGPHYPISIGGKTYVAILLNAKTRKT